MKLKVLILFFLCYGFSLHAQPLVGFVHFKREAINNSFVGETYEINILTLKNDSSFILQTLIFADKKERKECLVKDRIIQKGNWALNSDTLICTITYPIDVKNRRETFLLVRNKLYYFSVFKDDETFKKRKPYAWKRIKSINSDLFFP